MFRYVTIITVQNYLQRSVCNSARLRTESAAFLLVASADYTIHCKRTSLAWDFGDRPCPSAPPPPPHTHNIRGIEETRKTSDVREQACGPSLSTRYRRVVFARGGSEPEGGPYELIPYEVV
jgi:hypothetical protein